MTEHTATATATATARSDSRLTSAFDGTSTALEVIKGVDLQGRAAIVTGGASGIGVETVRALATAGALVTIAARDLRAAKAVADDINQQVGEVRVTYAALELGDLESIREFARQWGDKPLSILVNNAGVMACPLGRTKDGFEQQFGINHLGHFLLSVLLTPALKQAAPSRIVSLSSSAHMYGGIDFSDPNYLSDRAYHPFKAYGQAKTANALFAVEYDRRHQADGIRAFAVMPGVIETALSRHMTPELAAELGLKSQDDDSTKLIRKSVEQGAATTVWAATAQQLEEQGGLYLEDCAQARPFTPDLPRGQGVMPRALDAASAKQLWELSETLVGIDVPPNSK